MGKRIEYQKGELISGVEYVKDAPRIKKQRRAIFICPVCGDEFNASIACVKHHHQKSCGCLRRRIKNPYYKTNLYNTWDHIKQRCYNPLDNSYKNYGGRGIAMYDLWIHNPVSFVEYCMTLEGWDDEHLTIDRIDNEGNYEPDNLRFVSWVIQARNKRLFKTNTSGYCGVVQDGKRFSVGLGMDYKHFHIGVYDTALEAAQARDQYIIDNNLIGFNLQTR